MDRGVQQPNEPVVDESTAANAARHLGQATALLEGVEEASVANAERSRNESQLENRLVQVRLGLASSLFTALRAKHTLTAAHSLRMAIGCSAWAQVLEMPLDLRDELEVGALLHDIGKIGIPDTILSKPSKLTVEEQLVVDGHRAIGVEILRNCCASQNVVDIVFFAAAWYNGQREGYDRRGEEIPIGARMVAILDAFDAMTTDRVYRPAMSRERAMAELFQCAGTQFDPKLVHLFHHFIESDQQQMVASSVRRWLSDLGPGASAKFWNLQSLDNTSRQGNNVETLFHYKLLEQMQAAAIYIDSQRRITMWNRGAERMTGIPAQAILHRPWQPGMVQMRTAEGQAILDDQCPILSALQSGMPSRTERLQIRSRSDRPMVIEASAAPVLGPEQAVIGVAAILRDASRQVVLEEHLVDLHDRATRDPLTKISNRAEFDRVHKEFVKTHLASGMPCSLVISDIDFFKKINDEYGHQAGDEALVSFASLLQRNARPEDLVARYGGEEFVLLCADCDGATASRRADEIRRQLSEMPQSALSGNRITASFGVTEIQNGDTPDTMLRRADRGLLQAKDNGRNQVVQLGAGIVGRERTPGKGGLASWFNWFGTAVEDSLIDQQLITSVPLKLSVEKLRGFVADHGAQILEIKSSDVKLCIEGDAIQNQRRASDRSVPYLIDLHFEEYIEKSEGRKPTMLSKTLVHVLIKPKRSRDRRVRDAEDRARQLLNSLKAYLVAQEFKPEEGETSAT
jgi:diguanylate cyclase (GGDEF)-like protein/putative nucleotidyltransferase with HDIG domain/PAS domain S-box-containing protein